MEWFFTLDGGILLFIQNTLRQPWLDPLVAWYTRLGNAGLLWIVLSAAMLCHKRTRRAGITALMALALGFLCTNVLLKHLVQRTRPWLVVEGLAALIAEGDPNSFPSGHTTAAFAAAAAWWNTLPRRWMKVTGLVMAALMGLSRLYVGVHFPSDVLAGALVGGFCGVLAWTLARRAKPDYFLREE